MRNTLARPSTPGLIVALLLLVACSLVGQEVVNRALGFSPQYTSVLRDARNRPIALVRDLNGDGEPDAALLTVAAEAQVEPDAVALSDPSRLYADRMTEPVFALEAYFAGQQAIVTVELGRYPVWTDIDVLELTPEALPVAVRVRFRDRSSETTHLVVFAGDGSVSRLELADSRNEIGFLRDIDEDGRLDVVTARRVPEAGRGFETFLTLFELRDGAFVRSAGVPIVRSVSELLDEAERDMERDRWAELAGRIGFDQSPAVTPGEAFLPEADPETGVEPAGFPTVAGGVDDAVFPRVIDNPFPEPYLATSFSLVFRVIVAGEPRFYRATVGLAANPFAGRPVAFLTGSESGE